MKKVKALLLITALLVSGCAYNKQTLAKVKGDEVHVPISGTESIEGKGLKGTLYRNVSIAFPATKAIDKFNSIKSEDSQGADNSAESLDVQ